MPRAISVSDHASHPAFSPKNNFLSLNTDILVDMIFCELSVRDILCLRRTCKLLYQLSHQPVIWKRLLLKYPIPINPLPPSVVYSMSSLSGFEAERLVVRAMGVTANWKSEIPRLFKAWRFPMWSDISSIKLVPGGKYALVSVCRGYQYAISLCILDHRVKIAYTMSMLGTGTKAYNIELKYMRYKGVLGLTLAFMRRRPKKKDAHVNVSQHDDGPQVDFPVPMQYDILTWRVPYDVLHAVPDPRFPQEEHWHHTHELPQSFETISCISAPARFDFIDLDEIDGDPYLVCTQGRIVMRKNLHTGVVSHFTCLTLFPFEQADGPKPYRIRAIRILPTQRELLIVRTSDRDAREPVFLELYRIPTDDETAFSERASPPEVKPRSWTCFYEGAFMTDVRISAHGLPIPEDRSGVGRRALHVEPPPVSVYAVANHNAAIIHYRLWPERVPTADVRKLEENAFELPIEEDLTAATVGSEWGAGITEDGGGDSATDPEHLEPSSVAPVQATLEELPNAATGGLNTPSTASTSGSKEDNLVPIEETTFRFQIRGPTFSRFAFALKPKLPHKVRFLPGLSRPLLYGTAIEDRTISLPMVTMYAYADTARPPSPDTRWPEDAEWRAQAEKECEWAGGIMKPRSTDQVIGFLPFLNKEQRTTFAEGLLAIDWEDSSGRVCVASKQEPQTVYILDFAPTPTEGKDGHRRPLPVPDVDQVFRRPG
ncbi:hypothetical protein BV25DRAFT_1902163 [Artomyces pyxidatus]|uniref:Uncharacterized protein n=1 Tax=Artomyces pyxidatus TaxID=48021 RepID=A0ACB8SQG8_9AGAM|nr:hypothetical protein BV25DRAFT_1902163 [Artomyces pyxidatus]